MASAGRQHKAYTDVAELRKCLSNVHANPKGPYGGIWPAIKSYRARYGGHSDSIGHSIHFNVDSAACNVRTHISDFSRLGTLSWSSDTTPKDIQVADHSWQWTKFADKEITRECHGYFEISENKTIASPLESLRLFSMFLHFGATCTSFPMLLGKAH